MKKVLVIIMSYLVSGLLCFNLSAEDDLADKIHIHRTNPTTRSLIDLPEAIICRELLTVSHNASGVYSLQCLWSVFVTNREQFRFFSLHLVPPCRRHGVLLRPLRYRRGYVPPCP